MFVIAGQMTETKLLIFFKETHEFPRGDKDYFWG